MQVQLNVGYGVRGAAASGIKVYFIARCLFSFDGSEFGAHDVFHKTQIVCS